VVEPATPPTPTPTPVAAPPPPTPPPPPPPAPLTARVAHVDVQGALSEAVVTRAIARVVPALRRCTPIGAPQTVKAQFTIGESKRAQSVHVTGPAAATIACVTAALSGVRSETAPDTGDVGVSFEVAFEAAP
jgi:hypothetical protein